MHDLFAALVSEGRKRKRGEMLPSLLLASWFLRSCIFISAGLSVWVGRYESQSVFVCLLLVQCQREVQVGTLLGPTHILRPRGSVRQLHTSIRENPQLRAPLEQVGELTETSGDCSIVTGSHQCLAPCLLAAGLPLKINGCL